MTDFKNTTETPMTADPLLAPVFKFGDYCTIEQHRFGAPNEHYHHKVIGTLKSTAWVEVPVMYNPQENNHDEMVDVVACVCEGVNERYIFRYRAIDCKPLFKVASNVTCMISWGLRGTNQ